MIFVTVGTHEQPFNRLLECIDKLKGDGKITEDVVMQTGFSTYEPQNCRWEKLFSAEEMDGFNHSARIVITHGGPSSFIIPLQLGKVPIVVPRRAEFGEHINNHQVKFCNWVAERQKNIIVVNKTIKLDKIIRNYDDIVAGMGVEFTSHNAEFCKNFEKLILS